MTPIFPCCGKSLLDPDHAPWCPVGKRIKALKARKEKPMFEGRTVTLDVRSHLTERHVSGLIDMAEWHKFGLGPSDSLPPRPLLDALRRLARQDCYVPPTFHAETYIERMQAIERELQARGLADTLIKLRALMARVETDIAALRSGATLLSSTSSTDSKG